MIDHDAITKVVTSQGAYGKGITPNPYAEAEPEWGRRERFARHRAVLTEKIRALFEPRFITSPSTCEMIEALIAMTDSRKVLEVGMCTGFGSLHMLRALVGKEGAHLTSVDCRPALDREFFGSPEIAPWFSFVEGWTPKVLETLHGQDFDLIFVDSDHSLEHTRAEFEALKAVSHLGTIFLFHDVPEWQTPENHKPLPVRGFLDALVKRGELRGLCLPSCEQDDRLLQWGKGYPRQCNPGLGLYIRS